MKVDGEVNRGREVMGKMVLRKDVLLCITMYHEALVIVACPYIWYAVHY